MNSCFLYSLFPYEEKKTEEKISTSSAVVRPARSSDLKKVAEVLTLCFHPPQVLFSWLYPLLKLGVYEDLRARLRSASPHYQCFVACHQVITSTSTKEQEEIIGTVEISLRSEWPGTPPTAYISNLAVSSHCRRQGIARKLLLKCEQIALEWGFKELYLHVLEDNHVAKQLYLSSGYQLHRIDFNLNSWLFGSPRRLCLIKKLTHTEVETTATLKT
ncbi:GCN5-related N-acetyltransferase [Gloeothece citriformis PCC 7424]|uniref:GCN5-related N-acetyltransferase n=1 Tax=Gloeothece citriformis (strain PCC 7424) TaxID=65393 RepID=B7KDL7_GLOC7|nr:GNAT family N-acetyltransferase [Gloeothece citriformis]ACK70319.1 GCN5-related N-acetyltransferase [Gloeothece citriformis PCC 7424]